MKILLVEDEFEFAVSLRRALERERFVIDHADCIALAREAANLNSYDLVLLDRTLPDGDGLSFVPELRGLQSGLPIIVLSARGDVPDRVAGLDGGGDDYLAKPFALEELLARIRAVIRRPAKLGVSEINVGSLVFDLANNEARVNDIRLDLARREARVLAALVKRRERTVLRESLEGAVYGFDDELQSNTLDSHVSRLRRKLNGARADVEIHAIRGVGYLLRSAK